MNNGKSKLTVIKKTSDYGLYVWMLPNGQPFSDGNGNVMNIPARPGDIEAMSKITKAAAYYGAPEGRPVFQAGIRRITDEEHSEQLNRMKEGYIPSETDLGAWVDASRGMKKHGNQ